MSASSSSDTSRLGLPRVTPDMVDTDHIRSVARKIEVRHEVIRNPRPNSPPSLEEAREQALLKAHRAGDRTALAELLAMHQDRIYAMCVRMMGDREVARDLTQDTLVKIIGALHTFQGEARLSTWMTRIAMNACLSEMRRMRLRRHASLDTPSSGWSKDAGSDGAGAPSWSQSLPDEREHDAPERIQQGEQHDTLRRALRMLGEDHRAILILRDMHGLDYRQIGEVLEVPEGTVKSRLFRARATLREEVERLQHLANNALSPPES